MSRFKEIVVEAVLPTIKAVGKTQLENVLLGIKQHNTEVIYENTLRGIYSNFSLLKEAVSETNTKIDDHIIDLILEAVKENADADGITLL